MVFDWETAVLRLLTALLIGGLIGAEREYRDKSAGLRTLTLICTGSCLFTLVSLLLTNGTADRIASNIVTGIGFLGAGVIFKSERGVNGLTTAATIWATAAVGMAIGNGLYIVSIVACVLMLVILSAFVWVESLIDSLNKERTYHIVTNYEPDIRFKYERIMLAHNLVCKKQKTARHEQEMQFSWKVKGTRKDHDHFIDTMLKDASVTKFEF